MARRLVLGLSLMLCAATGRPGARAIRENVMSKSADLMEQDVAHVAPALARYRDTTLQRDLWNRAGLSPRDRSLVTVAALIARQQTAVMRAEFERALDNGVKPRELSETITHLAFYAGWPNVFSALPVAKGIFDKRPAW
jgi:4-carboxymuconolactone decarboxylase